MDSAVQFKIFKSRVPLVLKKHMQNGKTKYFIQKALFITEESSIFIRISCQHWNEFLDSNSVSQQ